MMDIRKLLKGTEYAGKAELIATVIERERLDNEVDIHNLPRLGHIAGEDVYVLLGTILKQAVKAETAVEENTIEATAVETKSKPKPNKKTTATKTDSGRIAGKRARGE